MRARTITVLLATAVIVAGCSTSTAGTGGGSASAATGSPAPTSTVPGSTAPATTVVPSSAPATVVSTAVPPSSAAVSSSAAPATSSVPQPVPAPKACAAGQCTKVGSGDLGDGYTAIVHAGPSPTGQVGADYLELAHGGVPVFWKTTDGYNPGAIVCSPTPVPNCAVEDGFGAHASSARGFTRVGNALVEFDEATSDTPGTDVQDLNGDGWIDVVAAQNTYEPSYATGKVFWTTALSNGKKFVVSGCTPPRGKLAPKPNAPVTGPCPS